MRKEFGYDIIIIGFIVGFGVNSQIWYFGGNMKNSSKVDLFKLLLFPAICLLVAGLFMALSNKPDMDCYYMAARGEYIWKNHSLPTENVFLMHDGFKLVVQQWLFCLLCYFVLHTFGDSGVLIMIGFSYIAIICTLSLYIWSHTKDIMKSVVITAPFAYLVAHFSQFRPFFIDIIVMFVLMWCLEKYKSTKNINYLLGLPLLSMVYINFHSSFWCFLFIITLPYLIPDERFGDRDIFEYLYDWFNEVKLIFATMFGMFLFGFINPNGVKSVLYPQTFNLKTLRLTIAEMRRIKFTDSLFIYVIIAIVVLLLSIKMAYNDISKTYIVFLTAGTIVLSLFAKRNLWFLLLSFGAYSGTYFSQHRDSISLQKSKWYWLKYCMTVVISIFILFISVVGMTVKVCDNAEMPKAALKYLQTNESSKDISIYCMSEAGSYFEFYGYKPYDDTCFEMLFYNTNGVRDIHIESISALIGQIDVRDFLDYYDFDYLVVANDLYQIDNIKPVVEDDTNYELVLMTDTYWFYKNVNKEM